MKNNKGITLIALVVTIIVILIIASITIEFNAQNDIVKNAKSNNKVLEISQVRQVVLQMYAKYQTTKNEGYLVGTKFDNEIELLKYENEIKGLKFKDRNSSENINYSNYYKIDNNDNLKELGIKKSEDYFIVNYKTGEVFNYTTPKANNGNILYEY